MAFLRIRRKAWARPELEESNFFINNPSENKGKWNECFKRKQPIHLELGCGKGTFISKLASQNPNINYIAIDIKSEMLGLTKRNIEKEYKELNREIDNVLITAQQIELIQDIFDENDVIDRIYINFCNPWPKARHNKKRLTHTRQLEKYKTFLKNGGEIYFKTDDDNLFLASQRYFKEAGFEIQKLTYNLHSDGDLGIFWNKKVIGENEYNDWTKAGLQYWLNTNNDSEGHEGYLSYINSEL